MEKANRPFSILFVCTGNLCRSPMAEMLFTNLLAKNGINDVFSSWLIESAGTWAVDGEPASLGAQAAMARRDLTLVSHQSQQITGVLMERFNLILVMEAGQKEALRIEYPRSVKKIFLLSEMIDENYNIEDPMGGNMSDYETAAREIEGILSRGFETIVKLAAQKM